MKNNFINCRDCGAEWQYIEIRHIELYTGGFYLSLVQCRHCNNFEPIKHHCFDEKELSELAIKIWNKANKPMRFIALRRFWWNVTKWLNWA